MPGQRPPTIRRDEKGSTGKEQGRRSKGGGGSREGTGGEEEAERRWAYRRESGPELHALDGSFFAKIYVMCPPVGESVEIEDGYHQLGARMESNRYPGFQLCQSVWRKEERGYAGWEG